ncbi:acyltransferase family protein [Tenuifilum osseticum]|uniref:acyltransferase family protein n=1 Tax=Tenuifilum osseticum TaxID=3374723 RepID=UPI0034E47BFC
MANIEVKTRQFDIDWLRIILILSVFFYHIGMVFVPWAWHIKNQETLNWLIQPMHFLHLWRMPLLFLISGVATYYAIGSRNSFDYIKERSLRLLLPLVVGMFLLVPVQVYIERINSYNSLLDFYKDMFNGIYPQGNLSWHHLWFIAYLFIISLVFSILINYFKSDKFLKLKSKSECFFNNFYRINLLIIPTLIIHPILLKYYPNQTNDIINDWAWLVFYFTFFILGFAIISSNIVRNNISRERRKFLIQAIFLTVIVFSIIIIIKNGSSDNLYLLRLINSYADILLIWACSMVAIGYSSQYLNLDTKFRKYATEAIYPFYLLHQPVIVIVAYLVISLNIGVALKSVLITIISLFSCVALYHLIIKRINVLRVIFGLKKLKK